MSKLIIITFLFGGIILLGSQCAPTSDHSGHELHLLDEIKAHQTLVDYSLNRASELDTAELIKVYTAISNVPDFFTEKRTSEIASFACSNCHSESLNTESTPKTNVFQKFLDITE